MTHLLEAEDLEDILAVWCCWLIAGLADTDNDDDWIAHFYAANDEAREGAGDFVQAVAHALVWQRDNGLRVDVLEAWINAWPGP